MVLPPRSDFRRVLRPDRDRSGARLRAVDPLFAGRATRPTHRSSTSAIVRSASTHRWTSTPPTRPPRRSACAAPRRETTPGTLRAARRRRAARPVFAGVRGRPQALACCPRLPATIARGGSFAPVQLGPDTSCRATCADRSGDAAIARSSRQRLPRRRVSREAISGRRSVCTAPTERAASRAPSRKGEHGPLHPRCLPSRIPPCEGGAPAAGWVGAYRSERACAFAIAAPDRARTVQRGSSDSARARSRHVSAGFGKCPCS